MNLALLSGKSSFLEDPAILNMISALRSGGNTVTVLRKGDALPDGCDMLLSVGGDGTFLAASAVAAPAGVPVLGVNLGRLGFLSENTPQSVAEALLEGNFCVEERSLLDACLMADGTQKHCTALNEVVASRSGSAMLGIDVSVCGKPLPTYWADGLLVATASGSTAYSLSVGGPIVLPDSRVLIISPVAPHNLNVRPLIVPLESTISLKFHSREGVVKLSADNNSFLVPASASLEIKVAQFSLKRLRLKDSSFIKALSDKLFWGEDKRNERYE